VHPSPLASFSEISHIAPSPFLWSGQNIGRRFYNQLGNLGEIRGGIF
jgi:hypothetical protein